jgi:hypothetical protein
MSTRQGSPSKGKGPARQPSQQDDNQSETLEVEHPLDIYANLQALQNAQVRQTISTTQEIDALKQSMNQLLEAMNKVLASQTTPLSEAQVGPGSRASPAPSGESTQIHHNYKPRMKTPPQFDNNKGDITYPAWKQEMLDKFEEDAPQFPTERSYMRFLFGCTKGDANKHLYPRYTSEESNLNPYTSRQEMFATLDAAFKNHHQVRDSRNEYKELRMSTRQSFHDFKTQFIHLANEGRIPDSDRFHDLYDKLTTNLQRQVVHQLHTMGDDFETLCTIVAGIDVELKRINARVLKEREAAQT